MIEIIRKGSAVTRLTVNKERITIKLNERDDTPGIILFLTSISEAIQADQTIRVTLRGALEGNSIKMMDDLRSFNHQFSF